MYYYYYMYYYYMYYYLHVLLLTCIITYMYYYLHVLLLKANFDVGLLQRLQYRLARLHPDGSSPDEDIALAPIEFDAGTSGSGCCTTVRMFPLHQPVAEGIYRLCMGPQTFSEAREEAEKLTKDETFALVDRAGKIPKTIHDLDVFVGSHGGMTSVWRLVRKGGGSEAVDWGREMRCANGHAVHKIRPQTSYTWDSTTRGKCDLCNGDLLGPMAMRCRGCDWDACARCVERFEDGRRTAEKGRKKKIGFDGDVGEKVKNPLVNSSSSNSSETKTNNAEKNGIHDRWREADSAVVEELRGAAKKKKNTQCCNVF